LIKIGCIIDNYHLQFKVSEFLKHLKSIAKVKLYVEESYLLNSSENIFDEDIFFVKGRGNLILGLVKQIEEETVIPIINPYKAIWYSINRFMNSLLLRKAGIPVPDFTLNYENFAPNFNDYIVKNIVDQKNYAFTPLIKNEKDPIQIIDQRALNELNERHGFLYYQNFINSKWEYKIYGIGEDLYFYKQLPVLVNPNKTESRQKINEISELKEYCYKAMDVTGLKLTSIDFLKSEDGQFFLTDLNSSPNFNYIKNGHIIVADFLLKEARK
jgi:glutathione synthase/RimK-type ligase-like ATP-grasp enzyme